MRDIVLNHLGIVCALGADCDAVAENLFAARRPDSMQMSAVWSGGREMMLGEVNAPLADVTDLPLPLRGRNSALLRTALRQIEANVRAAIARFGADRVGVVVGTSSSNIGETEHALRYDRQHGGWPESFHFTQMEIGAAAALIVAETGACGPAYTVSTACSSGAKAIAAGARLLRLGLVDAVIAGGSDPLCEFTIAGFSSLAAVSHEVCNPFSRNRCGINIGEGAALFLMTREPGPVYVAGWGETSDAHHMSAPEPQGIAAGEAMKIALQKAGLAAADIGYVNLHGTATRQNDAMESKAVTAVLGGAVPCSSTKAITGHTLGASGAVEAALCWLSMAHNPDNKLPPHWWDGEADPDLPPLAFVKPGDRLSGPLRYALSTSFAFGGSNIALILGRG